MSEVTGIVLNTILTRPEDMLEVWTKLKVQYFKSSYSEIFASISNYYNKFNKLPHFKELELIERDKHLSKKIKALELLEIDEDIDIDIAVEALIDSFTQDEVLNELYTFVDKITHYDSSNIITNLSDIVMNIENLVDNSEEVFLMDKLFLMDEEELHRRIALGLNNNFDCLTGGMELTHLVMIGGARGSGKSLVACNIVCNQYKNKDISLIFTIEMRAKEVNQRLMSILSGVSNTAIKNQSCTFEELQAVASIRKDFFIDSSEVFEDYLVHKDYRKFELDLVKSKKLNYDNQIIMIDNHALTLSDIDLNIQKFKARYGDKLKTVVVDHVNKIVTPDKYDWKNQISLSDKLKDMAAKYDVLMITPYQTDSTGEARFAKGLLDSADIALNITNEGSYMNFQSVKTRGMPAFDFNAPIDWDSLEISPDDAIIEESEDSEKPRDV